MSRLVVTPNTISAGVTLRIDEPLEPFYGPSEDQARRLVSMARDLRCDVIEIDPTGIGYPLTELIAQFIDADQLAITVIENVPGKGARVRT